MKIALVGTGQMGQAVEAVALARGHEVVARFDEHNPLPIGADPGDTRVATPDVFIDFTTPAMALPHIERYLGWGVTAVMGTTGWYGELDRVRTLAGSSKGALLYAPNFSIGVALVVRALRGMLPLLEATPEYDPFVHEVHHTRKVDSPSGTALLLAETLLGGLSRKERAETETQHGRIDPVALHVTSTRAGSVFGKHAVGFDSPFDYIEISHEAKGRQGFAFGAIRAAEWLRGRQGLYTLDDMLDAA